MSGKCYDSIWMKKKPSKICLKFEQKCSNVGLIAEADRVGNFADRCEKTNFSIYVIREGLARRSHVLAMPLETFSPSPNKPILTAWLKKGPDQTNLKISSEKINFSPKNKIIF